MGLIEVGEKAPDFKLVDQAGKTHTLKDFAGRAVVLYFYPEDDTDDCTNQACQFRDHLPDFRKVKAVVIGVSPDGQASHASFNSKHNLGFTLLADTPISGAPAVASAYGAWRSKVLFGRRYVGMVRTTYLINPEGKVARRWDRVRVSGHASSVLAAVRALHSGTKLTTVDGASKPIAASKLGKSRARAKTGDSDPPFSPRRGQVRGKTSSRGAARRNPGSTHRKSGRA